tara:strand:- start:46 stop:639 length:594 start_codon:yes stop_codon:yes gene_type:complete
MRRKYKRGGGLGERMRIGRYLADVLDYIKDNDITLTKGRNWRDLIFSSFHYDATKALMNGDEAYVEFLKGLVVSPQSINHILKLKKDHGEFKKDSRLKGLFKGATGYLSPKLREVKDYLSEKKDYLSEKFKGAKGEVGKRSNTSASSSSLLNEGERTPSMEGTGELYTPPTMETDARAKAENDLSKMKKLSSQFRKR